MANRSGRNRERRSGRRTPFREPKLKMLIVCEGANTEKQYFEQFAKFHRNSLVDVIVEGGKGVPLTVVRAAKERKEKAISDAKRKDDEFLKYQWVWCVFDVDNHPNVPEARIMAADNGIELAISNPCFELWLLLHHRDCPGELHRHAAQTMLKDHVAGYDKHVNFDDYTDGYHKAVQRAKSLDQLAESMGEPGRNPTTGVYVLTEMIIPPPRRSVLEFLDSLPSGPRSAPTWDEVERRFQEERDAWDR